MDHDELVADPAVAREFNVSLMTIWRWTNDPVLNFPPPIKIKQRNYRSRRMLESYKAQLLRAAMSRVRAGATT